MYSNAGSILQEIASYDEQPFETRIEQELDILADYLESCFKANCLGGYVYEHYIKIKFNVPLPVIEIPAKQLADKLNTTFGFLSDGSDTYVCIPRTSQCALEWKQERQRRLENRKRLKQP